MKSAFRILVFVALASVFACTGTSTPTAKTAPKNGAASKAPAKPDSVATDAKNSVTLNSSATTTQGFITGMVMAPSQLVSNNGATIITNNGAGVISDGGSAMVSGRTGAFKTGYRVLAISEQQLTDADVYLLDTAGNRIPGIPSVKTDAKGHFELKNVPPDTTFIVQADIQPRNGKKPWLQTIVRTKSYGNDVTLTTASTFVTVAIADSAPSLDKYEPSSLFRTAVDSTNLQLKPNDAAVLGDRAAIIARLDELTKEVQALKTSVDALKQDVANLQQDVADLKKRLDTSPTPEVFTNQPTLQAISTDTAGNPYVLLLNAAGKSEVQHFSPQADAFAPVPNLIDRASNFLAVDGHDEIWLDDVTTAVFEIWSSSGTLQKTVQVFPSSISRAPDGNLLVVDGTNSYVTKFGQNGQLLATYTQVPSVNGAAADADGNIWVSSLLNNSVSKISTTGKVEGPFQVGQQPARLELDGAGNLWVQCMGDGSLYRLPKGGKAEKIMPMNYAANDLFADGAGNIWTVNSQPFGLIKFAPDGTRIAEVSLAFTPTYGALDPITKNLWVIDGSSTTVIKVSPAGETLKEYSLQPTQ